MKEISTQTQAQTQKTFKGCFLKGISVPIQRTSCLVPSCDFQIVFLMIIDDALFYGET